MTDINKEMEQLVERLGSQATHVFYEACADNGQLLKDAHSAITALLRRVEELEAECLRLQEYDQNVRMDQLAKLEAERDALRAELEARDKQEPVGYFYKDHDGRWKEAGDLRFKDGHTALYAAPPAPETGEAVKELVEVGELVEIPDGFGTIFAEWNETRYKLPPGTKLFALDKHGTQAATPAEDARDGGYRQIIEQLWGLLDDIDTAGDMFKSDDAAYRQYVEAKQRCRFGTGITTDGYTLNIDAALATQGEK